MIECYSKDVVVFESAFWLLSFCCVTGCSTSSFCKIAGKSEVCKFEGLVCVNGISDRDEIEKNERSFLGGQSFNSYLLDAMWKRCSNCSESVVDIKVFGCCLWQS